MISIEFSHILGDEKINLLHQESYEMFLSLKNDKYKCLPVQGVILLDDYNFNCSRSSKEIHRIFDNSIQVFKESFFTKFAYEVLNLLSLNNQQSNIKFKNIQLKKNNKWTCSMLTTCWYLYRLGMFSDSKGLYNNKLINVLPYKFKNIEYNVIKLIKHIDIGLSKNIESVFIGDKNEIYTP